MLLCKMDRGDENRRVIIESQVLDALITQTDFFHTLNFIVSDLR